MNIKENKDKTRLTLFIDKEAKKQAQMLAIQAGTTISELFESLISKKGKYANQ